MSRPPYSSYNYGPPSQPPLPPVRQTWMDVASPSKRAPPPPGPIPPPPPSASRVSYSNSGGYSQQGAYSQPSSQSRFYGEPPQTVYGRQEPPQPSYGRQGPGAYIDPRQEPKPYSVARDTSVYSDPKNYIKSRPYSELTEPKPSFLSEPGYGRGYGGPSYGRQESSPQSSYGGIEPLISTRSYTRQEPPRPPVPPPQPSYRRMDQPRQTSYGSPAQTYGHPSSSSYGAPPRPRYEPPQNPRPHQPSQQTYGRPPSFLQIEPIRGARPPPRSQNFKSPPNVEKAKVFKEGLGGVGSRPGFHPYARQTKPSQNQPKNANNAVQKAPNKPHQNQGKKAAQKPKAVEETTPEEAPKKDDNREKDFERMSEEIIDDENDDKGESSLSKKNQKRMKFIQERFMYDVETRKKIAENVLPTVTDVKMAAIVGKFATQGNLPKSKQSFIKYVNEHEITDESLIDSTYQALLDEAKNFPVPKPKANVLQNNAIRIQAFQHVANTTDDPDIKTAIEDMIDAKNVPRVLKAFFRLLRFKVKRFRDGGNKEVDKLVNETWEAINEEARKLTREKMPTEGQKPSEKLEKAMSEASERLEIDEKMEEESGEPKSPVEIAENVGDAEENMETDAAVEKPENGDQESEMLEANAAAEKVGNEGASDKADDDPDDDDNDPSSSGPTAAWIQPFLQQGIKFPSKDKLAGNVKALNNQMSNLIRDGKITDPDTKVKLQRWLSNGKSRVPKPKKHFFKILSGKAEITDGRRLQELWDLMMSKQEGRRLLESDEKLPEGVDFKLCFNALMDRIPNSHKALRRNLEVWIESNEVPRPKVEFFDKMNKNGVKNFQWIEEAWKKLMDEANKLVQKA